MSHDTINTVHGHIGAINMSVNFRPLSYGYHKINTNLDSVILLARIDRQICWLHLCILVGTSVHNKQTTLLSAKLLT